MWLTYWARPTKRTSRDTWRRSSRATPTSGPHPTCPRPGLWRRARGPWGLGPVASAGPRGCRWAGEEPWSPWGQGSQGTGLLPPHNLFLAVLVWSRGGMGGPWSLSGLGAPHQKCPMAETHPREFGGRCGPTSERKPERKPSLETPARRKETLILGRIGVWVSHRTRGNPGLNFSAGLGDSRIGEGAENRVFTPSLAPRLSPGEVSQAQPGCLSAFDSE